MKDYQEASEWSVDGAGNVKRRIEIEREETLYHAGFRNVHVWIPAGYVDHLLQWVDQVSMNARDASLKGEPLHGIDRANSLDSKT